jgi:hypothetical protein
MTETHVTSGPETVTKEHMVTPPKRDRRLYMREYRRRVADNNPSHEFKDQIKPEAEIANSEIKPEPQSELNKLDEQITAEEYERKVIEADEATRALKAQIAAISQAQELNRQVQAARMAQRPPTRDELLEHWRQQGLSAANLKFLKDNPDLIDGWELTLHAANRATDEGHIPDTPEHREATKVIFHKWMAEAHQTAAAKLNDPTPVPAPAPRQQPSRSSHYSAPVSRQASPGDYRAPDPRQVTLSADEVEAARISGVSPAEYARQKMKYQQMKAQGQVE